MKLSEKLKLLREEKGMTQEQVCSELGIGIQSIRNYENTTIERIPNTIQLKMLKKIYNVTYEYLLDEDCENKTSESVDIGKKLKLSDNAIENILDIQYTNNRISDELRLSLVEDKIAPVVFSKWLENIDLKEFTALLHEYNCLNNVLKSIQYFYNIEKLEDYLYYCLENKKDLKVLYSIWNTEIDTLKNNLSKSIHSTLNDDAYSDLINELNQLKKYCETCTKKSLNKHNLNVLLNTISSLGSCYYDETKRNLKFCLFEITELIKNNLIETYNQENIEILPEDYKKLIASINKEVKN